VPKGKRPEDLVKNDLYIEAIIEFPELEGDDNVAKNTVPRLFHQMTVGGAGESPYVRMRLEADWQKGNTPDGTTDQRYVFITVSENEEVENLDEHKMLVTATHRAMIEIIYVPAIRNPSAQLKNASGTILWRIMNGINWPEDIDGQIRNTSEELENIFGNVSGFSVLQEVMGHQWRNLHSDIRYNQVRVKFSNDDLNTVLQKLDVKFFPTEVPGSYDVDALGEGLRSLFYLSLVSSLLEIEAIASKERLESQKGDQEPKLLKTFIPDFESPALTILAVEEPENHIAPHLLGRIMDNLHRVSAQPNAQVVVTSHTPAIVKRVDPESIRHLRICKEKLCTIENSIRLPSGEAEAYKYVKEAVKAYPEIYFARLIILGEGDTEEIIIPKSLELLGPSLDGCGICVTPLGGRFVHHFWKLLNELDIPHITLLDLDLERETGGWARIKGIVNQLIKYGFDKDEFFEALGKKGISISDYDLETMHNRNLDRDAIEPWLDVLESYDVFFASPLDMDFMMLTTFAEAYKSTAPEKGGPRTQVDRAVKATLKSESAIGKLYNDNEKKLMVWYAYLFLNRGKPSTHILALSQIEDEDFREHLPQPIKRLLDRVREKLKDDPFSQLSISEVE